MVKYLIGIDLGGTKISAALFDENSNLLVSSREPTEVGLGQEKGLQKIEKIVANLMATRGRGPKDVSGIGIGAPGFVNSKEGIIERAANFPGWLNVPVKKRLEDDLGIPTLVDHDLRVMVVGEKYHGLARELDNFICITVGTGIGMGLFDRGRVYTGAEMRAGDLGHVTMRDDGPKCRCGSRGCLEAMASGPAIARKAQEMVSLGKKTLLQKVGDIEAKGVFEAARREDRVAMDIVKEVGRLLGIAIDNVMKILDPGIVIVGGGVTEAGELLFEAIRKAVKEREPSSRERSQKIVKSTLGEKGQLLGAMELARRASQQ